MTWASWTAVLAAAALAGHFAAAQPADAQSVDRYGPRPFFVEDFEDQLDAAFETGEFVGLAVAVLQGPDMALLRTYGETQAGTNDPVGPQTVFRLASVSKGFSASLVAQLVEEGRLDWNDRVASRAPQFQLRTQRATNMVTLEHLMSHRVGLPHHAYDNYLESGESFDRVLSRLSRLSLDCVPGQCYAYQNVAFSVIGDIVEDADGRSFEQSLQTRLFDPLGMDTASVGLDALMTSDSWARPHTRRRASSPWRSFNPNENYYRVAPAGGLNASILDLVQWTRAQMGYAPQVLDDATRARLHTEVVDTPREQRKLYWMRDRLNDADYALGWRVYDYAGERLVVHAGGVAGYRAVVAFLPEHDIGVSVLWNSRSGRGWRIMPALLDSYLNLEHEDWLDVDDIMAAARETASELEYGSP